jgi:hypothetical protein
MRRAYLAALLALPLAVAGCGGGGGDSAPTPVVTPLPVRFDVQPCLDQVAAPGQTVANLVVPDTLKLDLTKPSAFPNGRTLADPVVDIMIAFAFTDLTKSSARAVANLPLDPSGNDVPLRADFPYLGLPQGNHPAPPPSGPNYNFRADPESMYVRVDRMGMPAVATILISTPEKTEYNDNDPANDATRKFVAEIQNDLTGLTNAIAKDIVAKGFPLCAKGA